MTVNVYTATQTGCTVNHITPIEGNSLFDINIGLVMQWHFVGLDKVSTNVATVCTSSQPVHSPLSETHEDSLCCDSDTLCRHNQSANDSLCCDSDNQSAEDIEIDEDTFQKGDQYSRHITGGPSASMMSVEDPEAFAEIV